MLGQRVDLKQRLERLSQLPRAGELVGVQLRPLADQAQLPGRQVSVEHVEGSQRDLRDGLAVLSVEVRRRVIGPVHVDHDPVERRKTRHPSIVRDPAAAKPSRTRTRSSDEITVIGTRATMDDVFSGRPRRSS